MSTDIRREHLLADAREAAIPDWVWEQVTCAGCGACVPRDEAERVEHKDWCATCAPSAKHYAAICEMSDGGSR